MLAAKMKHVNNTILAIIGMVNYIHNQLVNVIKWVMDQMSFKDKSAIQALIVTKRHIALMVNNSPALITTV